MNIIENKGTRLLVILSVIFVANALLAEFIGVKIFALEPTIGIAPLHWKLFGFDSTLNFTAGVIIWPFVFILTDIINEYYGIKGVRMLSIIAAAIILYAFGIIYLAIHAAPAGFWVGSNSIHGVPDMQKAYTAIMGQGQRIIVGSITAFLIGQLFDAFIFKNIKKLTGEKHFYLRATGSTLFSQLIDSFVVLYIAFVFNLPEGQAWSMNMFWAIGTVNFFYKIIAAIVLLPVLYFIHQIIDSYLGKDLATKMKNEAVA